MGIKHFLIRYKLWLQRADNRRGRKGDEGNGEVSEAERGVRWRNLRDSLNSQGRETELAIKVGSRVRGWNIGKLKKTVSKS